jgi:hypothetical protein
MPVKSLDVPSSDDQRLSASAPTYASGRSLSAQSYMRRALNVFHDNELVAPDNRHLELIARLALEAQQLFFTAALYHPEEAQLNHFFNEFVLLCVLPARVF